jgi:hypothetical protein
MKLELRIEAGKPVIFFTDIENPDKKIQCYGMDFEHAIASRAYMRSLPKPLTASEKNAAWDLLKHYAMLTPF